MIDYQNNLLCEKKKYVPTFLNNGKVDISNLLLQFQNCAFDQIEKISLGNEFCIKNNIYYVVLRIKGKFYKTIDKNQDYTLVTYPIIGNAVEMFRYAFIVDKCGNMVFSLSSLWVAIDRTNRRIRAVKVFNDFLKTNHPEINELKPLDDDKLHSACFDIKTSLAKKYIVSDVDIDSNNHMNNTRYFAIVEDLIKTDIDNFDIFFKSECLLNDILNIETFYQDNVTYIAGYKEGNVESFKIKIN